MWSSSGRDDMIRPVIRAQRSRFQGVAMTNAPDEPQAPVNPDAGEAPDPIHEPDDAPRFAPVEDADAEVILPDAEEGQS
jgi:hypothetical protein